MRGMLILLESLNLVGYEWITEFKEARSENT